MSPLASEIARTLHHKAEAILLGRRFPHQGRPRARRVLRRWRKALGFGHKLSFQDMAGNELAHISQKLLAWGHLRRVDFDPLGLEVVVVIEELELRVARLLPAFRGLFDDGPMGVLEFAKLSDRSLPRPALGSIRFDQIPVPLAFSLDFPTAWPKWTTH